ncbi:MAG: hypothetical protein MZV70_29805 [Desulfobacterales bacterium]|nr:hypothetical protein [Desulfobacterales bacterium]
MPPCQPAGRPHRGEPGLSSALLAGLPETDPAPAPAGRPVGQARQTVRLASEWPATPAFCFLLPGQPRAAGKHTAPGWFLSPLRDADLPPDLDGLYFGGGYPELFAETLAANQRPCAAASGSRVAAGMPIYAECGGFMYLCTELQDRQRPTSYPMAGCFPLRDAHAAPAEGARLPRGPADPGRDHRQQQAPEHPRA